jgi:hypothetical protein
MNREPEMFPLVENPQHVEHFDSFAELRAAAEDLAIGLNQIQSWFFHDENEDGWGETFDGTPDSRQFALCICMPRKTAFTIWTTDEYDRNAVETWIRDWVFSHLRRWYGMPEVTA